MTAMLPDVSTSQRATVRGPLRWVGMQGIDVPLTLAADDGGQRLHARADLHIDLPAADIKGIHMSRLYRLLDALGSDEPLTPASLVRLLAAMIASHGDCGSRNARLQLSAQLLLRRPALLSEGLGGWRAYPVRLRAERREGVSRLRAGVEVQRRAGGSRAGRLGARLRPRRADRCDRSGAGHAGSDGGEARR